MLETLRASFGRPEQVHENRASRARCPKARGTRKAEKGARGMPAALGGDEGRGKLRKAAARGKHPATRGCPNGGTRRDPSRRRAVPARRERGELKHLSTRRKRK